MLTVTVTEKQLRIWNSRADEVEASPEIQFIIHSSGDNLPLQKS